MIRFCDKEVFRVRIDEVSRSGLFSYFLNGHREDILCVTDDRGKYIGSITYTSLLQNDDLTGSIRTEKAVLNKYFWENGKKYFKNYEKLGDEIVLLPVINEKGQLLCFAYQDEDANRELRQLRELNACKDAMDFHDIFPQYDCVTIWECNELAYCLFKYLRNIGIPVRVKGNFWEMFDDCVCEGFESLDYRNLNIYAEGTWEKCENLREYLLRTVSVEFECINIIYESNIKKGNIRDAIYGYEELSNSSDTNVI